MRKRFLRLADWLRGIRLLTEMPCGCRIYRNWEKVTEFCPKHTQDMLKYGSVNWTW